MLRLTPKYRMMCASVIRCRREGSTDLEGDRSPLMCGEHLVEGEVGHRTLSRDRGWLSRASAPRTRQRAGSFPGGGAAASRGSRPRRFVCRHVGRAWCAPTRAKGREERQPPACAENTPGFQGGSGNREEKPTVRHLLARAREATHKKLRGCAGQEVCGPQRRIRRPGLGRKARRATSAGPRVRAMAGAGTSR